MVVSVLRSEVPAADTPERCDVARYCSEHARAFTRLPQHLGSIDDLLYMHIATDSCPCAPWAYLSLKHYGTAEHGRGKHA